MELRNSLFWMLICLMPALAQAEPFVKRDFPVDESINPCANLYQYACGKTNRSFVLPETRRRHHFSIDDIKEFLLAQKKAFFRELNGSKGTDPKDRQIRAFYQSCMDPKGLIKGEVANVSRRLAEVSGISSREQFVDYIFQKMEAGESSFLSLYSNLPNLQNSKFRDAYLSFSILSLGEKSYYEKREIREDYRKLIGSFFGSLKMSKPDERAAAVDRFEAGFAKVYPSGAEINKNVFSETTLSSQTIQKVSNLKLEQFFEWLPKNRHIRNLFGDDSYIYLNEAIGSLPLEELKSIYLYYDLKGQMDEAYPDFKNQMVAFEAKHLGGVPSRPDRQERCVNEIESKFGKELDYILLPHLFPNFPKEKLSHLVESVRSNLIKTVRQNAWLSPSAKKTAALKLEKLNIRLVSPESEEEWGFRKIGNYSSTDLIANQQQFERLRFESAKEDIKKEFSGPVWEFGPLEVNAALMPSYNAIIFPIAILQPPFYDPNASDETNLAGIGAVIGHEIGHAIDDKGFTYDEKGRVNPWIRGKDEKKFFERAESLIKQFDEIGHNGKFTLGENIGDLVGLTNSYESAFPKGSNKSISLKKDFFVQWARLWCEVQRPEFVELRKKVDPHSLGFARANEPVKHLPVFAEAFSCKPGDPLVLPASKRLKIW